MKRLLVWLILILVAATALYAMFRPYVLLWWWKTFER